MADRRHDNDLSTIDLIGIGFMLVLTELEILNNKVNRLLRMEQTEMADLSQLQADVEAQTTAVSSAVALLQGLKAALDSAGTDPQALADLSATLEANTQALSDAVVANTPAG